MINNTDCVSSAQFHLNFVLSTRRKSAMRFLILIAVFISCGGNAKAIRRSQSVPYTMGGSQITFSLIGIETAADTISCVVHFPDERHSIVLRPSVPRDGLSVICRLPPEIYSGRVDVHLETTTTPNQAVILSEAVFINPIPLAEVNVEENWDTHEISFTWNPEYFKQFFYPDVVILIQATLYVADSLNPVFRESSFFQVIGTNLGSANVSVSDANMNLISNIHYPYFYVLRSVGTHSDVYLSSVLFAPVPAMDERLAVWSCGIWMEIAKAPSTEEIHPCPSSLQQAELDTNFIKTEYNPQIVQLANGALDNHVLYYERVPTRRGYAQTCSYNSLTTSLVTTSPAEAGWIHTISKYNSYVDNYFTDVWPYIFCCLQSNSQLLCDFFHERRPIDTGHQYKPEDPCKGTGDPHMVTFESVKYDFMGWGEFWLIRGPAGSEFGVQGRMSPISEGQKVSYFKAVAIRDGNTTVQVQLEERNFKIIINGFDLKIPKLPYTFVLSSVTLTITSNLVDVRLQSGFTIFVENIGTYVNVFGRGSHSNKGKGFMGIFGNFDDDAQNDLTSQDGFVIPPTSANLRDLSLIHHRFGLTWMTTATESFFIYEDGKSWKDYTNRDFGPILQYPDPATLPEEVRAICEDSLFCYYEYVGTESLDQAADVARWEQEFDALRVEIEGVVPMCDVVRSPANGRVQVNGHLNGSLATYSCNNEYDFISGDRDRTCYASEEVSQWMGVEPECICKCFQGYMTYCYKYFDSRYLDTTQSIFSFRDVHYLLTKYGISSVA